MTDVLGAGSLFGLFALSLLLHVAGWKRLMRGADVLCLVQLLALCISPGWFAERFMPNLAVAYLTYCGHRAVQWEIAYRRELRRRSAHL